MYNERSENSKKEIKFELEKVLTRMEREPAKNGAKPTSDVSRGLVDYARNWITKTQVNIATKKPILR